VKSVTYEAVQTTTKCTLQGLDFGNKHNPCFGYKFSGGGTPD
jgi:hypothetical protein